MTMYCGTYGRDPKRLVVWLDDEMFESKQGPGANPVFYAALAPGLGEQKSAVLRALVDGTRYAILLSDEVQDDGGPSLCVFKRAPALEAEITYDSAGQPTWMTDIAWAVVQSAVRVQWLLDVRLLAAGGTARPEPSEEEFTLFGQQLRAIVSLCEREQAGNAPRDHGITVVSQIPPRELKHRVQGYVGGLEPDVFHQADGSAIFSHVVGFLEQRP